jgi:signal transduction histidine kinase
MVVVAGGFLLISTLSVPEERVERRNRKVTSFVELHGERAAALHQKGDATGITAVLRTYNDIEPEGGLALFRDGILVASDPDSPPVPAGSQELVASVSRPGRVLNSDEGDVYVVPLTPAGYVAVATHPSWTFWTRPPPASTLLAQMLMVLGISAVVCLVLVRRLTRPIQSLREAATRIAGGELARRVGNELVDEPSEVSTLARDFDRMAGRIGALLTAQQRLLRDVSHELRSPLSRLRVAIELGRRNPADPVAVATTLDRIARDVERLDVLVTEVLDLARLQARLGSDGSGLTSVALHELVAAVVSDADFEAEAQGRSVRAERLDPFLLPGHAEELRRAVENVVRNAIRFTPEGTAVVVKLETDPGGATLTVTDQGSGVPEEALTCLFEPFFRVEPDRERSKGGLGLGLAIAERAVHLHGGAVSARNVPGAGLEVRMTFPVVVRS